MHNALVRTEPAKHRMVRQLARGATEAGHQLIDLPALQRPRQHLDRIAHELVAFAQRKRKSGSGDLSTSRHKLRHRQTIFRRRVHGVAARAWRQGISNVGDGNPIDEIRRHASPC